MLPGRHRGDGYPPEGDPVVNGLSWGNGSLQKAMNGALPYGNQLVDYFLEILLAS